MIQALSDELASNTIVPWMADLQLGELRKATNSQKTTRWVD
jgi:hypothetical protein